MTKRRTITITETEYHAITEAFAFWHSGVYEEAELDDCLDKTTRALNRAMSRVLAKWREAGR